MSKEKNSKIYRTENKFDPYMTKDTFIKFISDEIHANYTENHKFQNYKVLFGILMIANVIYSHYHYIPYPQDYYILIACVLVYYVTTFIYQAFEKKVEKDIFILFDEEKSKKQYAFGAQLELFSNIITLQVYIMPIKKVTSKKEIPIENYLDAKGYIVQDKLRNLVKEMINEASRKTTQ